MKKAVVRLDLCDREVKRMTLKVGAKAEGLVSVRVDMRKGLMTLIGNVEAREIVQKLRKKRGIEAKLACVKEEEEKKKDDDACKNCGNGLCGYKKDGHGCKNCRYGCGCNNCGNGYGCGCNKFISQVKPNNNPSPNYYSLKYPGYNSIEEDPNAACIIL